MLLVWYYILIYIHALVSIAILVSLPLVYHVDILLIEYVDYRGGMQWLDPELDAAPLS